MDFDKKLTELNNILKTVYGEERYHFIINPDDTYSVMLIDRINKRNPETIKLIGTINERWWFEDLDEIIREAMNYLYYSKIRDVKINKESINFRVVRKDDSNSFWQIPLPGNELVIRFGFSAYYDVIPKKIFISAGISKREVFDICMKNLKSTRWFIRCGTVGFKEKLEVDHYRYTCVMAPSIILSKVAMDKLYNNKSFYICLLYPTTSGLSPRAEVSENRIKNKNEYMECYQFFYDSENKNLTAIPNF